MKYKKLMLLLITFPPFADIPQRCSWETPFATSPEWHLLLWQFWGILAKPFCSFSYPKSSISCTLCLSSSTSSRARGIVCQSTIPQRTNSKSARRHFATTNCILWASWLWVSSGISGWSSGRKKIQLWRRIISRWSTLWSWNAVQCAKIEWRGFWWVFRCFAQVLPLWYAIPWLDISTIIKKVPLEFYSLVFIDSIFFYCKNYKSQRFVGKSDIFFT